MWFKKIVNGHIYSQIHGDNSPDGGGSYFSDAFNILKTQGCTTLADMPYDGSEYAWAKIGALMVMDGLVMI